MSEHPDISDEKLRALSRHIEAQISAQTKRYARTGHIATVGKQPSRDHARRKAALEAAMRRGKLWEIVRAEFALDIESVADGLANRIARLEPYIKETDSGS